MAMLLRKGLVLPQEIADGIGILFGNRFETPRLRWARRGPHLAHRGIRLVRSRDSLRGRPIPEENVNRERVVVAKRSVYIPANPARVEHLENAD